MWARCAFVLILVGCGADPGPGSDDTPEGRRRRCGRHLGNMAACEREPGCTIGPPKKSCDKRICTAGGPVTCISCEDSTLLRGKPLPPACRR